MERKRKGAREVRSTQELVTHIKDKGIFNMDDENDNSLVSEIFCAMGAVDTDTQDPIQYFEEDEFTAHNLLAQLETSEPIMELDKKKAASESKTFVLQNKAYMKRIYQNPNFELHHGFTDEMMMAGYSILNALPSSEKFELVANESLTPAFIGYLEQSTAMVDKLSNFKWEKELYPPVDGTDEPPLERKWKATPAGLRFFQTNPGGGGSTPYDRLTDAIMKIADKGNSQRETFSGSLSCGAVRLYKENINENSERIDIRFGDRDSEITLASNLYDIMRNTKGVHPFRLREEVRIARIKFRREIIEIKSDDWPGTSLGYLVQSSGIKEGDVLEIASAVILKPTYSGGDISD